MKKLAFILFSRLLKLLSGYGRQVEHTQSIENLQAIISDQVGQLTELREQLQAIPDNEWNRWLDKQQTDTVLWHGLTVREVKQDLMDNEMLIPIEAARYGVFPRFSETSIYVGRYSVLAYASDGHFGCILEPKMSVRSDLSKITDTLGVF